MASPDNLHCNHNLDLTLKVMNAAPTRNHFWLGRLQPTLNATNGKYYLTRFQLHTPAQHQVSDSSMSMEMVFVFRSLSGNETVMVSQLLQQDSEPNKFLEQFLSKIPDPADEHDKDVQQVAPS